MSSDADVRVAAAGSSRTIGRILGERGRAAFGAHVVGGALWREVTDARHAESLERMAEATRARFPWIWEEIAGLAEGLDLPLGDVFAWNCRGDLLASVPDGCTSVMLPGRWSNRLGHNEDGLPALRGHCFFARIQDHERPGVSVFCYPGSIAGHTFAITQAGLAQTVNNLRLLGVRPCIPRMVLSRAVLAAETLTDALAAIGAEPESGGFHLALARKGERRLLSVEFGGGRISVHPVREAQAHANHALRLGFAQRVTESSRARQERGEDLLRLGLRSPFHILCDKTGALPIFRDSPDDPDEENTLASVQLRIDDRHVWLRATIRDGESGHDVTESWP